MEHWHVSRTAQAAAATCIALPWLWPLASGPSAAALPWLVSCTGFAVLLAVAASRGTDVGRAATRAWLIAALVSSVIGLVQYFGASAQFKPWIGQTGMGDAFANLRQRNQFATLTNLGLAVLLWGIAAGSGRRAEPNGAGRHPVFGLPLTLAVLACAILLACANTASGSRTGLLQLLALPLLALLWRRPGATRVWQVLAAALLAYGLAAMLLPQMIGQHPLSSGIIGRLGESETACSSRLVMWRNVLHLIALKPWTGWGWGELDYAHFMTLYPGGRFCEILDNAHNLPLHLAVELGIPVALIVSGLVVWLVLRARPWREIVPRRQLAWAVLALIGLHSMLEYPLWYGPFQVALLLALVILWRVPASAATEPADPARPDVRLASPWLSATSVRCSLAACSIALLLALAYAFWDYHRVSQIYRAPELRAPAYRDDTLRKIQGSWLFRRQVAFAALTTATVSPENAATIRAMAEELLHFSPESRVAEKLIESATLLGLAQQADEITLRYRLAFPADYAKWRAARAALTEPPEPAR